MSRTIDLQVEKSMTLINALKKKYLDVKDKGIKMEDLQEMEIQLANLKASSMQADELREKLSAQIRATNNILVQIKESYKNTKDIIRGYYPQECWSEFGVMGKR